MKKTLLFISIFLVSTFSFSQYSFSKSTGTYSNLVSPTSLTNGITWDDPQFTVPIGFNFKYFDSTISTFYIEDYGFGAHLAINDNETGKIPTLIPYGSDIIDRAYDLVSGTSTSGGLSPISYKLSGITGARILKIEWKNVGFYGDIDDDDVSTDFTNFQLWLYEGSNNIEIHFGPNSITSPLLSYDGEGGTSIELMSNYDYDLDDYGPNSIILRGNPTAPNVKIINTFDSLEFMNGTIPNGTIYKFTKTGGTASVKESKLIFNTKIYPNPANNFIKVASEDVTKKISQIQIMDMNGKIIKTVVNQFNTIDVSQFNSGIYLVKVSSEDGLISNSKFVKN